MKVIKKLFILVIVFVIALFSDKVMALGEDNIYYTNSYEVNFTKEEYDFVSKFYFDGYQKYMTQDDYKYMMDNDMMNGKIEIKEFTDENVSRAETSYATGAKKLQLSSACSTTCSLAITLTWKGSPSIRSYDLVGAYSQTSGNLKFSNSRVLYDGTTAQYTERRVDNNGVSATMKLPSSGENIIVIMEFKANKGTTVYASYQHAKKTISLANSRKYSFNSGGYGNVFRFEESVKDYYDAMGGVKLTL